METVTIQCGACGQVIAVSKEHLGQQVQCPLCGAVIEAPAPEPIAVPNLPPMANDEDSIFAPPEADEDIFGRREKAPEIQMPSATGMLADQSRPTPAFNDEPTEQITQFEQRPTAANRAGVHDQDAPTVAESHMQGSSELTSFTPRRYASRGTWGAVVMIFLVPYSIVITFALVYLLYQRSQLGLDRLVDPDSSDGPPVRIRHNAPLPGKLKTELNREVRVGDLVLTPLKVERTRDNDLVLHLKMQNVSSDVAFNPFPDSFHRYAEKKNKPYTFLESDPPVYGGYSARFRQPPGERDEKDDGKFDGFIRPNEVVYAELSTYDKEDVRSTIARLIRTGDPMLWRVHVRRGLVNINGRAISATAVIGVEFPPSAIEQQRG